ncbi:potassium channel family protein [Plectonema cf. radiosum LEGE 06105]|uniref:Potassium channel family protein n=1 Tax=Plectonema cf. radiosum LEGE 06105 TaxID=945769 RepID=A0A8J7EWH2_9CYAN|nr:potassium channel family protein [Plectonema radiosum]MBE9211371.1 potassium channel family protein [Plectonema cf. radiosum LEGE 06105]
MSQMNPIEKSELEQELTDFVQQLDDWLEMPMVILGFIWLVLLVVELIWGVIPLLEAVSTTIWILFIFDFLLTFSISPHKFKYLKNNWLIGISLLIPALRVFRFVRVLQLAKVARTTRSLRLLRIVGSLNRGMRSLRTTMTRRNFGYVVGLTLIVTFVGAAGMYAFESNLPNGEGIKSYSNALWWTAMLMTTYGGDYSPKTAEGRVLCFILALYAFTVFGYVTATLATFFIGRDAEDEATLASSQSITALHEEIKALRTEIQAMRSGK